MLVALMWASRGGGGGNGGGTQSNPGTPAGSYNVAISATSGSITQAATLSLKVE